MTRIMPHTGRTDCRVERLDWRTDRHVCARAARQ